MTEMTETESHMSSKPDASTPAARLERQIARDHFLDAIAAVVPRVFDWLAGEPYALRRALWERDLPADQRFADPWRGVVYALGAEDLRQAAAAGAQADPLLRDLAATLARWAALFHLPDDWVTDAALQTLGMWCLQGGPEWATRTQTQRWWYRADRGAWEPLPHITPGLFAVDVALPTSWNPGSSETRGAARERIMATLGDMVSARLAAIEADAKRIGLVAERRKLAKRHFDWLARWQIDGDTYEQIAHDAKTDAPTVCEAVQRTAAAVGLSPRLPSAGGRRRTNLHRD